MKRRTAEDKLRALDLVEEAVHTLRLAPAVALVCYYLGAAPFVLALLWFWSDMSRSGLADQHLVPGALGLTALFIWMKAWQAVFASRVAAHIAHESPRRITAGEITRMVGSQTLLHATGLPALAIAAQIILPFGWAYTFFQNATVFGLREPGFLALCRRSWKQARFSPLQNHGALLIVFLFGLFVFLSAAAVIFVLPMLAKMFLGVESPFTMSIESSLNTTFLMSALGVTYLCCDPLIKTIYALRCFYGEARTTGEDLLVSLRSFRAPAAALALALLAWMAPLSAADAPNTGTPPKTERGAALDQSIESVLRQPEYTWRSPRPKREEKPKEEAAFWERFRESFRKMMRSFSDWLDKLFRSTPRPPTAARGFSFTTENLVYVLIAVVVLIIGVLFYILWRTRSRRLAVETEATPTAPVPDLTAEDVAGDELPVDGWTALALELLERGELRLAMRAFYLSSLAHLAARNLVTIARFKSNRDYERELRRRSHALPELSQTFAENVSVFDRVWYGLHEINTDLLQQFRSNVERIRAT